MFKKRSRLTNDKFFYSPADEKDSESRKIWNCRAGAGIKEMYENYNTPGFKLRGTPKAVLIIEATGKLNCLETTKDSFPQVNFLLDLTGQMGM